MALTERQIMLVQTSFDQIKGSPAAVAALFYQRLFELNSRLRQMVKGDMMEQGQKLMTMLKVAVTSLTRLDTIVGAVQELGRRHARYGVSDADYDTVAAALLWTLEQGLGTAFTAEVEAAWVEVYTLLATVMQQAAAEENAALVLA